MQIAEQKEGPKLTIPEIKGRNYITEMWDKIPRPDIDTKIIYGGFFNVFIRSRYDSNRRF